MHTAIASNRLAVERCCASTGYPCDAAIAARAARTRVSGRAMISHPAIVAVDERPKGAGPGRHTLRRHRRAAAA